MSEWVADFSNQAIDLHAVFAAGAAGIISYVSDFEPKNLTQHNYDLARSAGKTVTLVCEQGEQPALTGTAGGVHNAEIANAQADELGYDKSATIYYVAEDPTVLPQSAWGAVEAHFRGIQSVGGRPRGAYGGQALVNHLQALGLVKNGWGVSTWSSSTEGLHLMQQANGPNFGLAIDNNTVLAPDYGQTPQPAPPGEQPTGAPPTMITPLMSFKPGQIDVIQLGGGSIVHYWRNAGGEAHEIIAGPFGGETKLVATFVDMGTTIGPDGTASITAEDTASKVYVFAQTLTGSTWDVNGPLG